MKLKCKTKRFLSLFIGMLFCYTIFAQQRSITGTVLDNSSIPLPGVTVTIEGTTIGTITDIDGNFLLSNIEKGSTLVFSFLGFEEQSIILQDQIHINIVLKESTVELDEVMVVAYGTQKKRDVTGAMYDVSADKLTNLPVGQFSQKIQGQLAGVQVNQTSGRPGEGMEFRIRGTTSINASNTPLFVVDGFPIVGDINNINPDEIESYTVLKDAAATSLYGSRAGNGVILITTKSAKQDKTNVSFSSYYGVQSTPNRGRPDVLNGQEFAQFMKGFYEDKIKYENWKDADGNATVPAEYQNPAQYGEGYNWYNALLRTAPIQNYSLSVTNRSKKNSFSVVGGYFRQDGVVLNTFYDRYSLRANSEFTPNKYLKLGFFVAPTFQLSQNHGTDGYRSIIDIAATFSPLVTPYDENGDLRMYLSAPGLFTQPNWVRVLEERENKTKRTRLLANSYVELNIIDGLKYKLQAGVDLESQNQRTFNPSTTIGGLGSMPPGLATGSYNTGFYYSWLIENMLTYDKTIKDHSFGVLAGYTAQKYSYEGSTINGSYFPDDEIPWINAASTRIGNTSTHEWAMLSYISRFNYSYKDKYLIQGSFRRDGSSRFGVNNRWADFPSISLGWITSDEDFFNVDLINFLKLRASYGITGNNNIGNYTHLATVDVDDYVLGGTLAPGKALSNTMGNVGLTWEESNQFNVGLETGLFKDRIFFMYDYYYKVTDGLLYQLDIPRASGFSDIQYNIGRIDFWGHEISLETKNIVRRDLTWSTNLNMSFNRNMVKKLGTNDVPVGGTSQSGNFNRLEVGQPVGVFMGYINDGVYMTQEEFDTQPKHASSTIGSVRYKDISGPDGKPDGIIDTHDRTIIGNPNPKMIFGITNQVNWKNFDLSVIMTGSIGGDIIARSYENTHNLDGVFNVTKDALNRWRSPENPGDGVVPRTLVGTTQAYRYNNTRWVSDATHLSLKNITVGYTLPKCQYYENARVYVSGQQIYVLTKYTGGNPEVSSGMNWNGLGVDNTSYPVPSTYTIGFNVTF